MQTSTLPLSCPSSLKRTAVELFAISLLEICPKVILIETRATFFGFYCDIVTPIPITEEYIHLIEERMRAKIKANTPLKVQEMVPVSAREYLRSIKQLARAEKVDFDETLVKIIRMGDYGNYIESSQDVLESTGGIGAFSLSKPEVSGKHKVYGKDHEVIRIKGIAFRTSDEMKAFQRSFKERFKWDHQFIGQDHKFFKIEKNHATWYSEGLEYKEAVSQKVKRFLKDEGFSRVAVIPLENELQEFSSLNRQGIPKFYLSEIYEDGDIELERELGLKDQVFQETLLVVKAVSVEQIEEEKNSLLQMIKRLDKILPLQMLEISKNSLSIKDRYGLSWEIASVEALKQRNGTSFIKMTIWIDRIFALLIEGCVEKDLLKNSVF